MNTRYFQHLTVLAALCCMLLFVAACEQPGPDQEHQSVTPPEIIDPPTADMLEIQVSTDLPTAVLSSFAENSTGAALTKRLKTVTSVMGDNTMMALVKGSDMSTVSDESIGDIADMLRRSGFLAIETPSGRDLLTFIARLIVVETARQKSYIDEKYVFGDDVDPVSDIASALTARYDARLNTMNDIATKAGIGSLDEVVAEIVIFSEREYFYQEPIGMNVQINQTLVNDDGNSKDSEHEHIHIERTPYTCGQLADDVADWLNGIDEQRQKTKSLSHRIATKAGGEESLNKLMDASETFTLSGPIYHTSWNKKVCWRQNSVKHTFRSWGVHNMKTNKDYYYIQQEVLIRMGPSKETYSSGKEYEYKIYYPLEENRWYDATGFGKFNEWYGSFFSRFITSMELTGKGNVNLEEAMPYTDNSTGYKTVNIGSEQSSTETIGITWGAEAGLFEASVNVGGEYSVGSTRGTYFEVSSTHVDNDITVTKNTEGSKVTWTYTGSKPTFREIQKDNMHYYEHTTVPKALISDIDLDHQIVWSVSNPSGQYTLNVTSHPYVAALMFEHYDGYYTRKPDHCYYETHTWEKNTFSHTLLDPFRATQTWRMYVSVDEMKDGGPAGSAASQIESRLRTKFSCFRDEFTLCDRTATSVQVINANVSSAKETFDENLDILQMFADEQGVKRYTIHWRCDDSRIRLREGYTVETVF